MSMLALDKWSRMFKIIKQNGGWVRAMMKLWRIDTLKEGKYMGSDCLGNRYYENKNYMIGRCRWVEFHPRYSWLYDATHVSVEWYGWLHYKTDKLPGEDWAKYCLNNNPYVSNWLEPHEENMSGTKYAFYPYSTTKAYVEAWNGSSIPRRPELSSNSGP